jgi:hypothetical protein
MDIILNNENVFEYLHRYHYCQLADRETSRIQLIPTKNFNLLIALADGRHLLVKQEIPDANGRTKGEFWAVWWMEETIAKFPDFAARIRNFIPQPLHFDRENSILIMDFLTDYLDLFGYYEQQRQFPVSIGAAIGKLLASLHGQTYQREEYQQFWVDCPRQDDGYRSEQIIKRLSVATPDIFATVPRECLQFFKLYRKFPALNESLLQLGAASQPTCLIHNDLKLNNFLIDLNWQSPRSQIIKLIDWERVGWGDPAFDLGRIIGSYLEFWLEGLIISKDFSMRESLLLATSPLESIQPSLFALMEAYFLEFPQIRIDRPNYLELAIQFAGLSLIRRIEIEIERRRTFSNREIIILQAAKQLICEPKAGRSTIFGHNSDRL